MILNRDAKRIFNESTLSARNLRGEALTSDKFETRYVNLVTSGQPIHAFIVAPVARYSGHADYRTQEQSRPKNYSTYGVYAVDEKTLEEWENTQSKKLRTAFNLNGKAMPLTTGYEILPTLSAAKQKANKLNETIYEDHIKDFQNGKLSGITAWTEIKHNLLEKSTLLLPHYMGMTA